MWTKACKDVVVLAATASIALASATAASAVPAPIWHRSVTGGLSAVTVDDAGNVYVTGWKEVRDDGTTLLVAKYRPEGARAWQRIWHPHKGWVRGNDISVGPDGSVYVVGSVNVTHVEGGAWFIRKYSADGRLLWDRKTPGWKTDTSLAVEMTAVEAGGPFVAVAANHFGCCSVAADDGWVRAYSLGGKILWTRQFEVPGVAARTNDRVNDVAVGGLGRVYVGGDVEMSPRSDVTERVDLEIVLQKLGPDGSVIWTRMFRDTGVKDDEAIAGLAVMGDRVIATGTRNTDRAWLARFTFGGTVAWSHLWSGLHDGATPVGVALTGSRAVLVVGHVRDPGNGGIDLFLQKYAPTGRLLWDRRYDGGRYIYASGLAVGGSGTT